MTAGAFLTEHCDHACTHRRERNDEVKPQHGHEEPGFRRRHEYCNFLPHTGHAKFLAHATLNPEKYAWLVLCGVQSFPLDWTCSLGTCPLQGGTESSATSANISAQPSSAPKTARIESHR